MSVPDSHEIDAELDAGLDRILVNAAMSALSAEHRQVLLQTYYAGHTVAEPPAPWASRAGRSRRVATTRSKRCA